jgi:hypothetical protein
MVRCSRVRIMLALGIAVIAMGTLQVPEAGAQWRPLNLAGWNTDGITDTNLAARSTQPLDDGCCAFFESGAVDDNGVEHDDGIPAGSSFQSLTGSGVTYLIQPAIGNNMLQIGNPTQTGTTRIVASGVEALLLENPAAYSQIAILSFSGNAAGCGDPCLLNVLINYSDGSGLAATYHSEDWCVGGTASRQALAGIPPNPSMNALLPTGLPVAGIGRTNVGGRG